jgi:hypothetical protein
MSSHYNFTPSLAPVWITVPHTCFSHAFTEIFLRRILDPGTSIVVNFMCQLDWIMGCPGIWLNIYAVSVKVFLKAVE